MPKKSFVAIVKNTNFPESTARDSGIRTQIECLGGESPILDWSDGRSAVWSEVIESQRQRAAPLFFEVDQQTNHISSILIPGRFIVDAISLGRGGDSLEVMLHISHAKHYLRRDHADFANMRSKLVEAIENGREVLVTTTIDEHEIIDVRDAPDVDEELGQLSRANLQPDTQRQFTTVTPARARELFNLVNRSCAPSSPSQQCIPFLYPDDGCWGRAHEMARLIFSTGVQPRKVWIYGNLRVQTVNSPACGVNWTWHVAPTLLVSIGAHVQVQVIDPSMFETPVPRQTWVNAQSAPAARVTDSDASVFYRDESASIIQYDSNYAETRRVLAHHRNQLMLRSLGASGPPPYSHCIS